MKEISAVERSKKTYIITSNDFIKGEWLELLRPIQEEGYSFEVSYINDYLVIKKFLFKNKEGKKE